MFTGQVAGPPAAAALRLLTLKKQGGGLGLAWHVIFENYYNEYKTFYPFVKTFFLFARQKPRKL
jgi:hypothetical protein